jgi:hypothetical protein
VKTLGVIASLALLSLAPGGCTAYERYEQYGMTFFVTSTGSGKGADFGGLAGADGHCQALATAAGSGHRRRRTPATASAAVHGRTPGAW